MAKKNNNEQLVSLLGYLFIGIIWYVLDGSVRKSKFATFHIKQAINFFIFYFISVLIVNLITSLINIGIVLTVFNIVVIVLLLIGIFNVINNKMDEVPIIGIYVERYLKF